MARVTRQIRTKNGVKEQKCHRCGEWKPMDTEHFVRDKRVPAGIRSVCLVCERERVRRRDRHRKRHKSRKRRRNRRLDSPDAHHLRILRAPGEPVWDYRDLLAYAVDTMLENGWLPPGTKLMDPEGQQYVARKNGGDGLELEELPPEQWHEFSAPNVRIDASQS